jgi:hypothetical protein
VTATPVDPFDLPEWLGTSEVTWSAESADPSGHHVRGQLGAGDETAPCDLLAVDQAYPAPVVGDDVRRLAHQAWTNGQVLLLQRDGRLLLAVPGVCFSADRVLDVLARLAKAVGARPEHFLAALRVGVVRRAD